MTGMVADWVSAAANVVLALAVVIGALTALRRWPVGFHVKPRAGPFHTTRIVEQVEHPPTVGWLVDLTLVSGEVANISDVRIERWRGWYWKRDKGLVDYNHALPVSLAKGSSIALHVSTAKSDKAPMRLRVHEYRSIRRITLPFVDANKN